MARRIELLTAMLLLAGCHASQPQPAATPTPSPAPTPDALAEARKQCPDLAAALSADPEGDARKAFAAGEHVYMLVEMQTIAISAHLYGVNKLEPTRACPKPYDRFRSIVAGTDTRGCMSMETAAGAYAARYNLEIQKLCAGPAH